VNASSVPSPLNLFVDGTLTVANIPYTGVSNYQVINAGTRTITVEAAATPGATLVTTSPTLTPATDSSIALYGSAGSLGALVLTDMNVTTLAAKAQVRFVNVSPDLPALDVYANDVLTTPSLLQNSASSYALLDAIADGTSYRFDFDTAGTTTPVLTLPAVSLTAGGVAHDLRHGPGRRAAGRRRAGLLTLRPDARSRVPQIHFARNARIASPCFATLNTPSRWPPSPSMTTISAMPP
jgi:hypothetical protein